MARRHLCRVWQRVWLPTAPDARVVVRPVGVACPNLNQLIQQKRFHIHPRRHVREVLGHRQIVRLRKRSQGRERVGITRDPFHHGARRIDNHNIAAGHTIMRLKIIGILLFPHLEEAPVFAVQIDRHRTPRHPGQP